MIPTAPASFLIPVQGGTIYTTPDQAPTLYCVYQHVDINGVVQYIGMCKLHDAYNFPDARHNSIWPSIFGGSVIAMTILATTPDIIEAQNERFRLAQIHKPRCNIEGYDVAVGGIRSGIRCKETGEMFDSIVAAAKAHDVSQSQLSNHLAGRKYFHRVKGRTYERVFK